MIIKLKDGREEIAVKYIGISICWDEELQGYIIISSMGVEKFSKEYPTEEDINKFRDEVYFFN